MKEKKGEEIKSKKKMRKSEKGKVDRKEYT